MNSLPQPSIQPQQLNLPAPGTKREKTSGERLFNWSVYAGIGWGVNAVLSLIALDWLEYKPAGRALAGACERGLEKALSLLPIKSAATRKSAAETVFFTGALYTGGTLLVPVMKYFEDHKGALVRAADGVIHGKRSDTDPEMIRAHEEMDHAPKQSWGSMMKARLLSLPLGMGIGFAVGKPDALSTQWLKGPILDKFSSFSRAGATIARGWGEAHPHPPAGVTAEAYKAQIARARLASPHAAVVGADPRRVRFASNTVYELLLSSFVAASFFATSHAFARWKDNKTPSADAVPAKKLLPVIHALPETSLDRSEKTDGPQPTHRVGTIQHEARLHTAPQQVTL